MIFDLSEEALIRNNFRLMYRDLGMTESLIVLQEIIATADFVRRIN